MIAGTKLCEIRVATYRRPHLLARALKSIQAQTYSQWRCIVFDDCRDGSANGIVDSLNDERFIYTKNPTRLGVLGNIDHCFENKPFASGEFACVVEDDNYLLPSHLEMQLENLEKHDVDVMFSAQWCERVTEPGSEGDLTDGKTIAWIYPEGVHDYRALHAAILFSHAFSNGSVFWRIGCDANLEIGDATDLPGIQETLRIFQIKCPVYVTHHPTAVWRSNGPRESYVTQGLKYSLRSLIAVLLIELRHKREMIEIQKYYINAAGIQGAFDALDYFDDMHRYKIEKALINCGMFVRLTERSWLWRVSRFVGASIFRTAFPSRLRIGRDLQGAHVSRVPI